MRIIFQDHCVLLCIIVFRLVNPAMSFWFPNVQPRSTPMQHVLAAAAGAMGAGALQDSWASAQAAKLLSSARSVVCVLLVLMEMREFSPRLHFKTVCLQLN